MTAVYLFRSFIKFDTIALCLLKELTSQVKQSGPKLTDIEPGLKRFPDKMSLKDEGLKGESA